MTQDENEDKRALEAALADYNRALELRPDHPDTLNNRGITYYKLERYAEALADFNRTLELRPDHPDTLNNRGITYDKLERYAEALADYNRALELRPDHPGTLNNRGITLSNQKRYQQAVASYQQAIDASQKLGVERSDYWMNLGEALYRLRWFPRCLDSFQKALDINKGNIAAQNGLGVVLLKLNRNEEALKTLVEVVKQDPEQALYHYNFAAALLQQKQEENAKAELRLVLDLDPSFKDAQQALSALEPHPPDWWRWWLARESPYSRRALGGFLVTLLAGLVVLPILYLVLPLATGFYGKRGYVPGLDWQYYLGALATVLAVLLLPSLVKFKAFGVEIEPQPPRPQVDLEPKLTKTE